MRKSLKVSLAATILALTSACGSGGADLTPTGAGASSPARAAAAESSADGLTRDNFVERLAAAQLAAGSAHMEMDGQVQVSGDVRLAESVEDTLTKVTMDVGATQLDLRMVDGVVYLNMGGLSEGKFVKIDLQDQSNPIGRHFGSMADQVDPTEQLRLFDEALVEFENEGSGGEIDGVETTKLRLVLDTSTVLKDQAVEGSPMGAKVPKELDYVLYVGSDDLLRRMTMELGGTTSTIDWSRWGEPVEVSAPPASQVTDGSRLGDLAGLLREPRAG